MNYDSENLDDIDNNVALIELNENVQGCNKIQIELGEKEVNPGVIATFVGWQADGAEELGDHTQLQSFQVPVVSIEECKKSYVDKLNLKNDVICAGKFNESEVPCLWGRAGLLVFQNQLIGIVQFYFQPNCTSTWFDKPFVYTSIAPYRKWISGVINFEASSGNGYPKKEQKLPGEEQSFEFIVNVVLIVLGISISFLIAFSIFTQQSKSGAFIRGNN